MKRRLRLPDTLFFRVFGTVVVANSAIALTAYLFIRYAVLNFVDVQLSVQQNLARYFDYVIADLEATHTRAEWLQVAATIPLGIRRVDLRGGQIETPHFPIEALQKKVIFQRQAAGGLYEFYLPRVPLWFRAGLLAATVSLVVLGAAFFVIRRQLIPLHSMQKTIEAVGVNDLVERLPLAGASELKTLAAMMNHMVDRVKDALASQEGLLRDVSHELRAPIARLRLAIDFIKDEELRESMREDLDGLTEMTDALLKRVTLDHQLSSENLVNIDVTSVLETLVKKMGRNGNVVIDYSASSPPLTVSASEDALVTVFRNVLDNAAKYSRTMPAPVSIKALAAGDHAVIEIADKGIGIAEADLQRIGDPFFRAANAGNWRSGFGLGLSLSIKVVNLLGGRFTVESRIGEGTRVTISLPLSTKTVLQSEG